MTLSVRPLCLAALVVAATACDDSPVVQGGTETLDAELRRRIGQYGPVPIAQFPPQNPALVELGRALMFDKVLSGNRDIACGTCHEPSLHATDGLPLAVGTGGTGVGAERTLGPGRTFVPRNAPSLLNSAIGLSYVFWDGRLTRFGPPPPELSSFPPDFSNLLVAQAMMPVLNRREMRGEAGDVDVFGNPNELAQFADTEPTRIWTAVMQRVLAIPEYVRMFGAAYPGQSSFTMRDAAGAMATFQVDQLMRTGSPFDRYLARDDNALSVEAKRGGILFFGDAKCSQCHNGPFLGGQQFANSGVPQLGPGVGKDAPLDLGRGALPNMDFYKFAFRVPPLRNVELTAPYMHNGAFATLESVVAHYNDVTKSLREFDPTTLPPAVRSSYHGDGTTINAVLATLDFRLRDQLHLTEAQQHQLVEFLKSLTDPAARDLTAIAPASVPSGLPIH